MPKRIRTHIAHSISISAAQHTANVRAVLDRADRIDREEGMHAYLRYHATLGALAAFYGVPLSACVGAFCALSPNNDYLGNLRSTASVLNGYALGMGTVDIVVSTYRSCLSRAMRVVQGEDFLSFTKGPKTRAFYQNILDPADPEPVTVDGHMVSIWCGARMTMVEAARAKWRYEEIAEAVRAVARERALLPNQVQAITWHTWKRIHNVRWQPQLNFFDGGNHWSGILRPEEIRPFPRKG